MRKTYGMKGFSEDICQLILSSYSLCSLSAVP